MEYHNIFILTFYSLAILGPIIKLLLNLKNIHHINAKSHEVPEQFKEKIHLRDHQKAAYYTIDKLKFNNIIIIWHFCLLLIWIPLGGLAFIDDLTRQYELSPLVTGLIFFTLYTFIGLILDLPESWYQTFVLEEKYGFNKTTKKIFFTDLIKQIALGTLIGLPFLAALIYFMQELGNLWWLWAWGFVVAFQFILLWAYPKFIAPLFNKFSKMEDIDLKDKINSLIQRCDLEFKDYFIMNASLRSAHGNAYFTGFGKNKRIVFFDTLIQTLEDEEVISVLAHELGHLKYKHILKSLLWSIIFMGLGFYLLGVLYKNPVYFEQLSGAQHSSYLSLILFSYLSSVFTFFLTPINSWLSRKKEYEADEFASKMANGQALISALVKMYKDNSSTLTPSPTYSKFYYSHPPALERINFINKVASKNK